MTLPDPTCLSAPDCGLCFSRRLDGRPEGWITRTTPEGTARILGPEPEAEAG
jgi:hypothetical protein